MITKSSELEYGGDNYIDIHTREDLLAKEPEIRELFAASFSQELDPVTWRWFYHDNPVGPALVSLFYNEGRLLGHYAVIPTRLTFQARTIVAYRSMTTMVHPEGRGRGLFVELANRVYAMLTRNNATLVYGFPNQNSAHGFGKYLGWTVLDADRVVDFRGSEILADQELSHVLKKSADIQWDMQDRAQSAWRFNKPDTLIHTLPGLVTKMHNGIFNVLHLDTIGLDSLEYDKTYRVLVPADFRPESMQQRMAMPYQFGFRVFDPIFERANFRRELVMSDVF